MIVQTAAILEKYTGLPSERAVRWLRLIAIALSAAFFVFISTVIVAFEDVLPGQSSSALGIGSIAGQNIHAPINATYISQVLTERSREEARRNVAEVYDPPDPNVARQQTQLARYILDFINNIRRDAFGSEELKINDINQITALTLDETIIANILAMNDETWQAVDAQIVNVLELVMQDAIRESDLPTILNQLPTRVSVRFSPQEAEIIVALVEDLVRPNTFPNPDATSQAKNSVTENTPPVSRTFARGEIVVREGKLIDDADFEALSQLGLLRSESRRLQELARATLTNIIVMVMVGLYIARFKPELYDMPRFLLLLAVVFLLVLLGARIFGGDGQIYLYPSAALALLFVALSGLEVALIGMVGLGLLVGIMAGNSLEAFSLTLIGGLIGMLSLRRPERLNSYFLAGLVIALTNMLVVTIFNLVPLGSEERTADLGLLLTYSLVNGVLSAASALVGLYIITQLFNLPTSLKLVELSQPNQPLLQRLLREAPGTYQHSLQVANLSEQAASAIGANAELVRVAALYHDIGKMLNPAFFVENQADNINPHDDLNDPYRSADIIISHVTDGDKLARQYRLPTRIRDFILEHHGTTQVAYFYRKAVEREGSEEAVDIEQFTYPGPAPRSRETAIMMLADSCESTVRARRPASKQEISDIIQQIIDYRTRDGQLDDSGLTSIDIKTIRLIFGEMLQAVFHPRINYPSLAAPIRPGNANTAPDTVASLLELEAIRKIPDAKTTSETKPEVVHSGMTAEIAPVKLKTGEFPLNLLDDDDDSPLPEVPPLPRTGEHRGVSLSGKEKANLFDESSEKENEDDV
jgi:cyclic-di-AMP phosphodiesterase PgpH